MRIKQIKNICIFSLYGCLLLISACLETPLDLRQQSLSTANVLEPAISSIDIVDGKITVQTSHTEIIKSVTIVNHATGEDILIIGSDNLDVKIAQAIEQLAVNSSDVIHITLVTDSGESEFEITTKKSGEEFVSVSFNGIPDDNDDSSNTTGGNSDNTPPTVSIGSPSLTIADSSDTVTYTLTYEVAPSPALASGDISFGGTDATSCSVSNIANAATTSPVVSISGCSGEGTVNISVLAGNSKDTAGNTDNGAGPSTSFNVTNIAMKATFRVGNPSFGDGDNSITLPLKDGHNYNATVYWGDGNSSEITSPTDPDATHTYASSGDYTVMVSGTATAWSFANGGDGAKLISVDRLGDLGWTDLGLAFAGCTNLESFTTAATDTSAVTDMNGMFYNAASLTSIDLSSFNTSAVTDMSSMFYGATSLNSSNLTSFNTSAVTDMSSMFYGATSLNSSNLTSFDTSNVTDMRWMFRDAQSLTSLDLNSFNTSKVTHVGYMFSNANSLTGLDLSSFNTSAVTDMKNMFADTTSLTSLDVSSFNTSAVSDMIRMFSGSRGLTNLNLTSFDTSSVTDMGWMFAFTDSLTSLNLTSFNTSAVTTMSNMFEDTALTGIDVSSFNTSSVINMNAMFGNTPFTNLDLSNFDTSNVTGMIFTFAGTPSLTTLDISSFDTSKVQNMDSMFLGASSLTNLDLSHFNTSSLVGVTSIFENATSLTSIDLTNWDTTYLNANFGTFSRWNTNMTATIYCNDPDNGGVGTPGTGTIFSSVASLSATCN
jgi:surface protein